MEKQLQQFTLALVTYHGKHIPKREKKILPKQQPLSITHVRPAAMRLYLDPFSLYASPAEFQSIHQEPRKS